MTNRLALPFALAPLLGVVHLASCGDDSGEVVVVDAGAEAAIVDATSDTAAVDATGDTSPIDAGGRRGILAFTSAGSVSVVNAAFYDDPSQLAGGCTKTMVAMCTLFECGPPTGDAGLAALAKAGTLVFSGGGLEAGVSVQPNANGRYSASGPIPLFAPGDVLTVTATGDVVPAFTVSVVAPNAIALTSPLPEGGRFKISTANDATFTWSGALPGAEVALEMLVNQGALSVSVDCRFDAIVGTGTIPKAALTKLAGGTNGSLLTLQARRTEFTAGTFPSSVNANVQVSRSADFE